MTLESTNQTLPTGVSQVEVSTEPKEVTSVNLTINPKILELLKIDALNLNHLFVLIALEAKGAKYKPFKDLHLDNPT